MAIFLLVIAIMEDITIRNTTTINRITINTIVDITISRDTIITAIADLGTTVIEVITTAHQDDTAKFVTSTHIATLLIKGQVNHLPFFN